MIQLWKIITQKLLGMSLLLCLDAKKGYKDLLPYSGLCVILLLCQEFSMFSFCIYILPFLTSPTLIVFLKKGQQY